MKITYKPRGNYIVFRGAQNPERIKSLKDSRFPFAIAWIEELAEFKTEDDVKTITNSLLRGELADGLFINSFIRTILLSDDNHGLIRNMNLASNLRILSFIIQHIRIIHS